MGTKIKHELFCGVWICLQDDKTQRNGRCVPELKEGGL